MTASTHFSCTYNYRPTNRRLFATDVVEHTLSKIATEIKSHLLFQLFDTQKVAQYSDWVCSRHIYTYMFCCSVNRSAFLRCDCSKCMQMDELVALYKELLVFRKDHVVNASIQRELQAQVKFWGPSLQQVCGIEHIIACDKLDFPPLHCYSFCWARRYKHSEPFVLVLMCCWYFFGQNHMYRYMLTW